MNYKIESLERFEKDVRRLKKRFPKIKEDLKTILKKLYLNPRMGIHLGDGIFKIRISNSSIPTGKSGGFRVITYYKFGDILYLVTIYSKSDTDNVVTEKIKDVIKKEINKLT